MRTSGGEPTDDWGTEGVDVYIQRAVVAAGFHWGTAIQCQKTGKVIVINRGHTGVDV